MRKDFNSDEIIKLLDTLIGNTEAVGETNADDEALGRLEVLCEVTDWCLDGIHFASNTWNRNEASMQRIGMTAMNYLKALKDGCMTLWLSTEGDSDEP